MTTISSNTVAIKMAKAAGTLRIQPCYNERLGITYWAILDHVALIEVCLTAEEAREIIASV